MGRFCNIYFSRVCNIHIAACLGTSESLILVMWCCRDGEGMRGGGVLCSYNGFVRFVMSQRRVLLVLCGRVGGLSPVFST